MRGLRWLRFCCYFRPGVSGGPVGHPVHVGNGTTRDVVAHGGGLVAFLGVGAGMIGVPMSNTISVGPAVAHRVRSLPPVGVIAAAPPTAATPGLCRELITKGFDLVGEGGVGGGKRGVGGDELLEDSLLAGGGTGKVVKGIVNGVEEARIEGGGVG